MYWFTLIDFSSCWLSTLVQEYVKSDYLLYSALLRNRLTRPVELPGQKLVAAACYWIVCQRSAPQQQQSINCKLGRLE